MTKIYRSNQRPQYANGLNYLVSMFFADKPMKKLRGIIHVTSWHLLLQNVGNLYTPKHTFVPGKLRIIL